MIAFHKSLTEIRNRKLWRMKYDSWDDFCRLHLDYTGRRGNQVIAGSKLLIALPAPAKAEKGTRVPKPASTGSKPTIPTLPDTEGQARELARLGDDADAQSEAFSEAVDVAGGKQPSMTQIREVVDARLGDTPLDGQGSPVTIPGLREAFLTRAKLKAAANHLTAATKLLKEVRGEPGASEVVPVQTVTKIAFARTAIMATMPDHVCPTCGGVDPDECEKCTGRGWLTKEGK